MLARRHPRYTILLSLLFLCTLALLLPHSPLAITEPRWAPDRLLRAPVDPTALPTRVRKAERIYQRMLRLRDSLITKYGPRPEDIVLFPPDKDPWPPYTVWDFFPPSFNCPHEMERVGTLGDGGKWVCGLSRLRDKEDCVVYSVGSPADASFEAELLARTKHCQLFLYDANANAPPRALTSPPRLDYDFAADTADDALAIGALGEGPWDPRGRVHFKQWGVAGWDAHGPRDKTKLYTLQSVMRLNGHTHIDLLKVDLEGWEFDAVSTFLEAFAPTPPDPSTPAPEQPTLPVGQLLLELHLWQRPFADFLRWWTALERVGLRAVAREANLVYQNYNKEQGAELAEYTFLNIHAPNIFTSEPAPPTPADGAPLPSPAEAEGEAVVSKEAR